MTFGMLALPLELLRAVTVLLDLDDFYSLIHTCGSLSATLGSEATCKDIVRLPTEMFWLLNVSLKDCISHSREASLARQGSISYRMAVAGAFRRRRAFALGRPFSALVVGQGSDFLYNNGVLCYLCNGMIRVMNLYEATTNELVIDLSLLLANANLSEQRFKLMHYRENTLTILRTPNASSLEGRLLVFDTKGDAMPIRERVILHARIPLGVKQVVRSDSRYLIYSTYTGTDGSNDHVWRFWRFSLVRGRIGLRSNQLGSFSTADVGSDIVFEIFDGRLYIVTSQITFDAEGQDPTSYYGVCRYNVDKVDDESPEKPAYRRIWRRQQREGPIHDLWTDLALRKDEQSGNLVIHESRREWQDGYSQQKRTFYAQPLIHDSRSNLQNPSEDEFHTSDFKTSDAANSADGDTSIEWLLSNLVDDSWTESLAPPIRLPRNCHPEYHSKGPPPGTREFSLVDTKHRYYNPSCSAFLDVVLDSEVPINCPKLHKQIRLRIGSRVLAPPFTDDGFLDLPDFNSDTGQSIADSEEHFIDRGIRLWPPIDAPAGLINILNPGSGLDNLKAISDERTIVYMASPKLGNVAPIILINFDPAIKFPGLKSMEDQGGIGGIHHLSLQAESASTPSASWMRRERALWQDRIGYQLR